MKEPSGRADVIVVGAGMAGLTAARAVAASGHSVVVLDKGRAVGGRMATRRIGNARYDHGAQHFSARSGEFRSAVGSWEEAGVAAVWFRSAGVTDPEGGIEPRHAGTNGMRGIPEHLAGGIDVRTGIVVERIEPGAGGVAVHWAAGVAGGRTVIVTAPLPQAASLVAGDSGVDDLARSVEYDPCLAVMAELDGPSGLDDGHAAPGDGDVAWIGDNAHKGISPVPAVTIHSSADFARAHLEADAARWVPLLTEAAASFLAASIRTAVGHRWRYARPQATLDTGCYVVPGAPLIVAGEVFAGARVEGAFLSGRAAGLAAVALLEL